MPFSICLMMAMFAPTPEGKGANPAAQIPEWSRPGRCGTNSLYVLLRLMAESGSLAKEIPYADVVKELLPEDDRGCSIADIEAAALRLGVRGEVRKVGVRDLPRVQAPFIAHLDLLDRGAQGHFIAIYNFVEGKNGTYLHFVDGTTGQLHNAELSEIEGALTGFVFLPESNLQDTQGILPWSIGLLGLCAGGSVGWALSRRGGARAS